LEEEAGAGEAAPDTDTDTNADTDTAKPSGPRIKLSNLGLRLHSAFESEEHSTFGFLAKGNGRLVVAFRGSLAGNAVSNLNALQIPLPSLKRSRKYFTTIMRRLEALEAKGVSETAKSLSSDDEYAEVVNEADLTFESVMTSHSMEDGHGDTHTLAMETILIDAEADADLEADLEDEYFSPQRDARPLSLSQIKNSELIQQLRSVSQAIPLLNQGFARVHAGFWQSYLSIREDFMRAVVVAILSHLKEIVRTTRHAQSLSPHASIYIPNDETPSTTTSFGAMLQAGLHSISIGEKPQSRRGRLEPGSGNSSSHTLSFGLPALDVSFAGHSLGAAIASIAALELASNLPLLMEAFAMEQCFGVPKALGIQALGGVLGCPTPKISLHMFGSPRIGNSVFAQRVAQKIETVYRVSVNGDIVPMMPKFIGFYRHIGTAVVLDDGETGSIIVQPSIIESSILGKNTGTVHNHSLDKYRSCLEACFDSEELEEYLKREFETFGGANKSSAELPEWILQVGKK
jgi:hypothetical protein